MDYSEWAHALFNELFMPENAGRPVFLYVDGGLLGRLAATDDTESAVEGFAFAVRRRLGNLERDDVFRSITVEGADWFQRPQGGPPACLPFLALCVLAASRMADQGAVASHNYYVRLRELLGLSGRGMIAGFDWASPALWQGMATWMDETMRGDLGVSTIRSHPRLTYIGYPLSQTIFRASDREVVAGFLAETGSAGRSTDGSVLLEAFRAWARGKQGLSPGLRSALKVDDLGPLLGDILNQTIRMWDGSARTRKVIAPAHLLIVHDRLGRAKMHLIANLKRGMQSPLRVRHPRLGVMTLEASGEWMTLPFGVDESVLARGVTLDATSATIRMSPRAAYLFVQHPAAGGWISVDAAAGGLAMQALVRSHLTSVVEDYLEDAAQDGWRSGPSMFEGWTMVEGLRLRPDRRLPPDARLRGFAPSSADVVDVIGGLPLEGIRTFIEEGAPDIVVRTALSALPVTIDDRFIGEAVPGEAFPLRNELEAGTHRIGIGGAELTLIVRKPTARTSATRCHEVAAWRMSEERLLVGAVPLRGDAPVTAPDAPPVTLAEGSQYVLLGHRPGELLALPRRARPTWAARLSLLTQYYEVWPPFAPVWIIRRGRYRREVTNLRHEIPGSVADLAPAYEWARWLVRVRLTSEDPEVRVLWERYMEAATEILSRA